MTAIHLSRLVDPLSNWAGRRLAGRERDVRQTLWLLAAVLVVLAPQVVMMPGWVSALIVVVIVWRGAITWRGRSLPRPWVAKAIAAAAGCGIALQYGTVLGRQPGVVFITLLLALKLLEMKARRDVFVLIVISFFVMLTTLFESQSALTAAALFTGLWMMLTALVDSQMIGRELSLKEKGRIGARLLLKGLPIAVLLFITFPRVQGPLWGLPGDAYSSKTGLSDSMTPGSFGKLAESREPVFEVTFSDDTRAPAASAQYWRGPVLGAFDGATWTALADRSGDRLTTISIDETSHVHYVARIFPQRTGWLFALDVTPSAPRTLNPALSHPAIRPDLQAVNDRPIRDEGNAVFMVDAYTRYHAGVDATPRELARWLTLPADFNPRARAYAQAVLKSAAVTSAAASSTPARRTHALVDRFLATVRSENFVYTLDPPPSTSRDSIDEFLFESRRGYCEHYASAFVFLMRLYGIPARVVTGYAGGDVDVDTGRYTIRQLDAHAWGEVWIPTEGWVRVDPTAAVSPDRVETSAGGTLAPTGDGTWSGTVAESLRKGWSGLSGLWSRRLLAYSPARQQNLLSGFGIPHLGANMLVGLLVAGLAALAAAAAVVRRLGRRSGDPVLLHFARGCAALAACAARRSPTSGGPIPFALRPDEGGTDFLRRITPHLPGSLVDQATVFVRMYECLRYDAFRADEMGGEEVAVRHFVSLSQGLVRNTRPKRFRPMSRQEATITL